MKTKKLPLLLIILALFLYSCEFIDTEWGGGGGSGGFPTTTQTRTFKAINPVTNTFYNVNAVLLYKGKKCDVWGEQAANVSQYTAQNVANDYDNNIYSKMMSAFNSGESFIEDGKAVANNPMEYASWMVDGDGKLTILLLNINAGSEEYIVAGYFHPINLLWDPNSNYCNMIYINSKLAYDSSELNNTVAHEMQHLMNFAISINKRSERNSNGQITGIKQMDTWIDEGLAGAAEWVWSGEHSMGRVRDYNEDRSGTIKQGNNFYVWESKPASILDDYATSYLFFQWLRLQAGSAGIYKTIINSSSFDYRAVTTAANGAMTGKGYNDWGTLLKTWLAANYINAPTGQYGYKNDEVLKTIQGHVLSGSSGSYSLLPGEGVYTLKTIMPDATTYIKYAGLPSRGSTAAPNDTSTSGSSALLSYNIDTRIEGGPSPANPFSIETVPSRSAQTSTEMSSSQRPPPYIIGLGDILRLNGHEETIEFNFSEFRKMNNE